MHEEGDHATKKQLSGSLLQGDGLEKRLEQWECILHDQHGRLLPQRLANGPLPHHHFAQICRKEEAPLLLSPHTSKKAQLQNPDETKSLSQEFAQVAEKATAVGLESPRWSRHFSREQDLARVREASSLGASA